MLRVLDLLGVWLSTGLTGIWSICFSWEGIIHVGTGNHVYYNFLGSLLFWISHIIMGKDYNWRIGFVQEKWFPLVLSVYFVDFHGPWLSSFYCGNTYMNDCV